MSIEYDETAEPVDSLVAGVARIPSRDDDAWTPPAELDEYKLVQPIGRGGMGSVWLAHDRLLDRLVAVKFIAHAEPDAETRARFAVEARAAARLQHENVVTVHRFGELGGRPYLVSEYIRGESLDKLAKPVDRDRAFALGLDLARGLAAAHRAGIVHRDIKPGNAILGATGGVKLVDFGLAQIAEATETSSTIAGTPRYLAPEVRAGEPATPRTDVYGIGSILYELVTGSAPILDARDGIVPSVGERAGRLAPVIDRCLAADPDARFTSGEELRDAVERLAAPQLGGELPAGNPYRGLVAFEAEHRALFFGRGSESRAVIERMRADGFVLVTGDSGVGKSSLCRAGVLPHVTAGAFGDGRTWMTVTLVPGSHPISALAAQLAGVASLDEARLVEQPLALARELRRALGSDRGVVVFVDQLEELVTVADRAEATAFASALGQLVVRTPGVRVLATVRSDFLTRLAELPVIGGELARALYLLRPLGSDGAREAIVGPARAKGGRFESEGLVDELVASVADPDRIELPLLAFTLAQLWEVRDPETQSITQRSLDAIGGVRGALARHADGVLEALLPGQREAARRLLLRLVTPDRTRARRAIDPSPALDALVRGRLVIARGGDEPTYELAHERLIDGWPTLSGWLSQSAEAHAAHQRLAAAVADWERLGRPADALWNGPRLAELGLVGDAELSAAERAFVTAARRAVRRRRLASRAIVVVGLLSLASFYVGAKLIARRDVARHIDDNVADANRALVDAFVSDGIATADERVAFALFDVDPGPAPETIWTAALAYRDRARTGFAAGARSLEAALLLDSARDDVRARLAAVTRARLALAERTHRDEERTELASQLVLYDPSAAHAAPARLAVTTDPSDATVTLDGAAIPATLAPGLYVVVANRVDRAPVRVPVALHAGEDRRIAIELPPASAVPSGLLYIPAGTFLFGSADPEAMRKSFPAAPMHARTSKAFLIGRTEVTYRQWITFLEMLPPEERERRRPHGASSTVGQAGTVELREVDHTWILDITPAEPTSRYVARAGEPVRYGDRKTHAVQDWLDMPVSSISPQDAVAYAAWLAHTNRVPHARLCTDPEWEYAARGIDGRVYPAGDSLQPDDANIDVTYGKQTAAFGPDVVGSHPRSNSVFGLVDTVGNVYEITSALEGFNSHGGSYYNDRGAAYLANHQYLPPTQRDIKLGLRICADLP